MINSLITTDEILQWGLILYTIIFIFRDMSKPNLLLAALFFMLCGSLILFSCNKTEEPDIDFSVSGLTDVLLSENGSEELVLNVDLKQGSPEQVTLSVEGLPDGVSASFNTTTGQPNFESKLFIKDDSSSGGVYDVTLMATSASGVAHPYNFKLTTLEKTCAEKLSDIYLCTITYKNGGGKIFNNLKVSEDDLVHDKMNFIWGGDLLYINVDCNTNKVTMPLQYTADASVRGDGYVDEDYSVIRINYTEYYDNGDSVGCIAYFKK